MSIFVELAKKIGQERAASGGDKQYPYNTQMVQKSALFNPAVTAQIEPKAQPSDQTPSVQPAVDTTNAIVSLADMMGPTPGEKAQREAQLRKGRAQMNAWAGLFDGLRHLGNLYATSKGAVNQKYTDNPYQQTDAVYQAERQRMDDLENYRRQYAMQLYNLNRQANDDKRKDELHKAQLEYYNTRDEAARSAAALNEQKQQIEALSKVRVIQQKDGSIWKFDPVIGDFEQLKESDPLYREYVRSQTNRNNRQPASSGKGGKGGGKKAIPNYSKSGNSTTNKGKAY